MVSLILTPCGHSRESLGELFSCVAHVPMSAYGIFPALPPHDRGYLNHIKVHSPRLLPGVPVRSGDATFPKAMDNVTVRQGESATLRILHHEIKPAFYDRV
ncbi:hypothetical protein G4228_001143 [Cervus hanglu yarkandensis]|nr:hypothetical protein G4228_001143 [Cervus hanglu yarkandensis]